MKIWKLVIILVAGRMLTCASVAALHEPWLSVKPRPGNSLRGVAFGAGLFVTVGDMGIVLTSTDGANWTARTEGTNQLALYAVTFGGNGFVAVGATWESLSRPAVWTSPDGITWTPRDVSYLPRQWLQGVTYGHGLYVAVGGNAATNNVVTSTDGVSWSARQSQLSNTGLIPLNGVAYGNGLFVAVGPGLLTSTDGILWTPQDSSAWYRLYAVTHAAGRFVAVGPYSRICSTDGTNWLVGTPPTGEYLNGVTYGDGLFVCVGYSASYSTNGANWTGQSAFAPGNAVAYGNGVFVAVGNEGIIYRTMAGMHLGLRGGSVAQLTLTGLVPGTCRIEARTDIGDTNEWSMLDTIPFTNSPAIWTDWSSTNAPKRFYRSLWAP